jgi:hypothetical protein
MRMNLPKAEREFSDEHVFSSKKDCSDYIDSKEYYWVSSYYDAVQDEVLHKNGPYGGRSIDVIDGPGTELFEEAPDPYVAPFNNRLTFRNKTK